MTPTELHPVSYLIEPGDSKALIAPCRCHPTLSSQVRGGETSIGWKNLKPAGNGTRRLDSFQPSNEAALEYGSIAAKRAAMVRSSSL